MNIASKKIVKRNIRHRRVRSIVSGTGERPRLAVFRSLKNISAQVIDDTSGKTLVSASSKEVTGVKGKTQVAEAVGKLLAEKAVKEKINQVVFDRGGNRYHGRVKALADGARSGGLQF